MAAIGGRNPTQQRHGDLGAEAGAETQGVAHRVHPALGQVEHAEVGVDLLDVGDRGHDAGLERLDGQHVLHADSHRVAREALGVGDHQGVGVGAEHRPQRVHLGLGAATARRGVGLVRHEHAVAGDLAAAHAPAAFGVGDETFHHTADVVDIEAAAVERAVGGRPGEQLADRCHPARAGDVGAFDDDRRGTHADQHAVTAPVEWQRSVFDDIVGGGGAARQEAGTDPFHQRLVAGVVAGDDDDPVAASEPDPVLGDRHRLGRRRTGGVDLGVGAACADVLGELGVAHRQDPEQETTVERIRVGVDLGAHLVDHVLEFADRWVVVADALTQVFEARQPLASGAVTFVGGDLACHVVEPGERGREDDPGVVTHPVGQTPTVGQRAAGGRGLVVHRQRDPGVTQCVDAGADRQLRRRVERRDPFRRQAELGRQVELAALARELDHVVRGVDRLPSPAARLGLHQPGDLLVDDRLAAADRDRLDERLAVEQPGQVGVVEDTLGAGQAEAGTRDDDGFGGRGATAVGGAGRRAEQLRTALDDLGQHAAEFEVAAVAGDRGRRDGCHGSLAAG